MPDNKDNLFNERLKKEIEKFIPLIEKVTKEYPGDTEFNERLNKCLKTLNNEELSLEEKREALVIVENEPLEFLLSEKGKGSK